MVQCMGECTRRLVGGYAGILFVTLVAVGWFGCWLASSFVGG